MLSAPKSFNVDNDARAVWSANPHLQLTHADFGEFAQAHRLWSADRASTILDARQLIAASVDEQRTTALTRLLQLRNPAGIEGGVSTFERKGTRLVWWCYGPIGGPGMRAADVLQALDANRDALCIYIRVACGGGLADDALQIASALRCHPARTIAVIDRYAYSAGSVIASAAHVVLIRTSASWMDHESRTVHWGTADSLVHRAASMRETDLRLARVHASRRRVSASNLRRLMTNEAILTAEQAVTAGVCDRVIHDLPLDWDKTES